MKYITITCDIKDSRLIKERDKLQFIIIDMLKECNVIFKDHIASPFLITLGDEWQGLLKENSPFEEVIDFFKKALPESIKFYVGIGIGDIIINNFELTVNQLDGSSFHLARKALKYAKRNNCSMVLLAQ